MLFLFVAAAVAAVVPQAPEPGVVAPVAPALPSTDAIERMQPVVVARFVETMRDNITLGTLPDGTPMQRETAEERKQPILPVPLTQKIFDRGLLTGAIEACGGEGEQASLEPMLAGLRAKGELTPKQLGFAKLLHNAAREQTRAMGDDGCAPENRATLARQLLAARAEDQR